MNQLKITKINNGFLIDWKDEFTDECKNIELEKKVIEEINGNSEDCMKRLLDFINEFFK